MDLDRSRRNCSDHGSELRSVLKVDFYTLGLAKTKIETTFTFYIRRRISFYREVRGGRSGRTIEEKGGRYRRR